MAWEVMKFLVWPGNPDPGRWEDSVQFHTINRKRKMAWEIMKFLVWPGNPDYDWWDDLLQ